MDTNLIHDEWEYLKRFFPEGWEIQAFKLGAIKRRRKIDSPEKLLRLILIHIGEGISRRTAVTYARQAGICDINDVALLHRLKVSVEWLRWFSSQLLLSRPDNSWKDFLPRKFRLRLVDATTVSEPGSTGSDWRIHYCYQLNSLSCDTFKVTDYHTGESLEHFPIESGDLILADRGYCRRKDICYVLESQGDALIRFNYSSLPLKDKHGKPWPGLEYLRQLQDGEAGDWDVWIKHPVDSHLIKGRLCALGKTKAATEKARRRVIKEAGRRQKHPRPETLEYAGYIIIFTTLSRHQFSAVELLTLYRVRWQIENVFKRLKGILELGHLPNTLEESCLSWFYGKMIIALLVECLYREAETISPWGYPI